MKPTTSSLRVPEYADVQALVRFGHGGLTEARFLMLEIVDVEAARKWLNTAPVSRADSTKPGPSTALQIAFGINGLRALGISENVLEGFSEEFIGGMSGDSSRSRRLGDVAHNAPDQWAWGGNADEAPHLLLMLYAKAGQLQTWSETIEDQVFTQAFRLTAELGTVDTSSVEPFGFADGLSQPAIDWDGQQTSDVHARARFSNLLTLGELLLGYTNEYGQYTRRPLIDPNTDARAQLLPRADDAPHLCDLGRNGSYLVMRQLAQDVPAFWQFMDQKAEGDPQRREQLASAMVGRRRNGTPLVGSTRQSIEGIDCYGDQAALNQFDFDDDTHGASCPMGAHIRRANPRTGDLPPGVSGLLSRLLRIFGFGRRHPGDDLIASTRFHRLLRRGRVYGQPLSPEQALAPDAPQAERGLHFVCLVANISRQFEFVQNAWSMGPKFGGVQDETDPLLGNRQPLADGKSTDHFSQPDPRGPAHGTHAIPPFVTVRGGAYFFMPGIRALRYLAASPASKARTPS